MKKNILIISNESNVCLLVKDALQRKGFSVATISESKMDHPALFSKDHQLKFDIVISLLKYNTNNRTKSKPPEAIEAIIFSKHGSDDGEINICHHKIFEKNYNPNKIQKELIATILNLLKKTKENNFNLTPLDALLGESEAIKSIKKQILKISQFSDLSVLITGETGTGKELVANAIHYLSDRKNKPLVKINCAAIPDALFESQLFGHIKGAFTGAASMQKGLVKQAHGGTLFLDEINEMKYELQPKILRFLEDRSFLPVGSVTEHFSDLRIIAASNQNLKKLIDEGKFRSDLYYRIKMLEIHLKPLRERREDIIPLAELFLKRTAPEFTLHPIKICTKIKEKLIAYDFPGNIRELKNIIYQMIIYCAGSNISWNKLPDDLKELLDSSNPPKLKTLKQAEQEHIQKILDLNDGLIRKTARDLGVTPPTLRKKLRNYGINMK